MACSVASTFLLFIALTVSAIMTSAGEKSAARLCFEVRFLG
jgi:hypothetical protein